MQRRHLRLLVIALIVSIVTLWWGCTQPEDIIVSKSTTVIHLLADRLPTTPPGMTYQLWVADTIVDDSLMGSVPIDEPFTYNFKTNRYHETDGTARPDTNRFQFAGDVLTYQWIFMSVQRADGSGPIPGPVMLMDSVTQIDYNELNLVFPLSEDGLSASAIDFSMETPSDGDRLSADGAGIWFSVYDERAYRIVDTTDMTVTSIETIWKDSFTADEGECVTSIVNILNIRTEDTLVVLGFDTLQMQVVRYDQETATVCDSGQGHLLTTKIELDFDTLPERTGRYDDYTQVAVDLPDLRRYGWWYRGWVTSSVIRDMGVGVGQMTPPAWVGLNKHDTAIHAVDGALLSTGLFHAITLPDEGNPNVVDPVRVPPYPGEDFLRSIPPNSEDVEVNLVPGGYITGSVFIAMHPTNAVTDTTNFPLIIQLRDLPWSRDDVEDDHQQFIMFNHTNTNTFGMGTTTGLPKVQCRIVRY